MLSAAVGLVFTPAGRLFQPTGRGGFGATDSAAALDLLAAEMHGDVGLELLQFRDG
jgi:hypothetical protein